MQILVTIIFIIDKIICGIRQGIEIILGGDYPSRITKIIGYRTNLNWVRVDDGSYPVDCLDSTEYAIQPYKQELLEVYNL